MPMDENAEKNHDELRNRAEKTIRRHMYGAFSMGLIPIPVVDVTLLVGVQLSLVRKLTRIYDVPFSKNAAKNVISSILAGALPTVGGPYLSSLVKVIPVVGFPLGVVSAPFIAAAATFAMGQVFTRHFESGGTLLTIDKEKVKDLFATLWFGRGVEKASEMFHETDKENPEVQDAAPATDEVATGDSDHKKNVTKKPKNKRKSKKETATPTFL